MKRREFIALTGGAAVGLPLVARAQQAMPVVGYLYSSSAAANTERVRAFRQGLKDTGYIEGENLVVEYRWAEGSNDRLTELAADLARKRVAVLAAPGTTRTALAAKAATTTIPTVFAVGEDPVGLGLVASLARPGGNLTGINFFNAELWAKRLELLRELVPAAARIGVLVNPADARNTQTTERDIGAAASTMRLQIQVVRASTIREIDIAFATLMRERPDALFVAGDEFFNSRRLQLALLAARHAIPASYGSRDYPESGGLVSYGTNLTHAFRQVGVYVGRILKGAKPADLPVIQADKFELIFNASSARILGLTVPPSLLARADEVIE